MAKYYNNRVKTGKLAGSVFAIRNGETIERAYQPIVSNPSTAAQVESRAKLKLLSQVSAVLAPYIAIPRLGMVSPRNRFVQENYDNALYSENTASFNILATKLTKSVVALSNLSIARTGSNVNVSLGVGDRSLSRVVYLLVERLQDSTLRVASSSVVSTPGDGFDFQQTFPVSSSSTYTIMAYGVRDNNDAATARFADMVVTAERVAQVVVSRTMLENDITLTETRCVSVPAAE